VLNFEIKHGCTRTTFLLGNYAVKVPMIFSEFRMFLLGLIHNQEEKRWSRPEYHQHLNPVLFSVAGGWLNVYRRAEALTDDQFTAFDYHYFTNYACRVGGECVNLGFVEHKQDSFGTVDGRILAIDYG
jgi:hypothetical protein